MRSQTQSEVPIAANTSHYANSIVMAKSAIHIPHPFRVRSRNKVSITNVSQTQKESSPRNDFVPNTISRAYEFLAAKKPNRLASEHNMSQVHDLNSRRSVSKLKIKLQKKLEDKIKTPHVVETGLLSEEGDHQLNNKAS